MSIRRFFRRRSEDSDLARELQSHIAHEIDDNMARGASEGEATRQAHLKFGNPQRVREDVWRWNTVEFLDSVERDLRFGIRAFRQRPGFVAVALLTLALGIGTTTVMFTVVNGVLLRPLSYPEPQRLVTLHVETEKYGDQWGFANLDFLDCQRETRSLDIAAWTYSGGTAGASGHTEYLSGREISPELFSVLGISLVHGRSFLPDENLPGANPVIVISHNLWQTHYAGNPDAIGKKLIFDGKDYSIVGIAPAGFRLDGVADTFIPLGQSTVPRMQVRESAFLHVVARLHPGIALITAQAELSRIAGNLAKQYPASNADRSFLARPLRQELVADVQSTIWLLLSAVSLLLLIACANVASLVLSRAVSREREFAVRVALGAGRRRLVRQCLTESTVLGIAGGTLGILLATVGIRPLLAFWPGSLPRAEEVHLDWQVLLFALAVSMLSGLLFGLAPALRAPARELEQSLRAGARTVAGGSRGLHKVFVASEITLATVLLVCAGMLGRTLLRVSSLDPGLNIHNVLISRLAFSPAFLTDPAQTRAAWQQVLDSARRVPGVQSVTLTDIVPMREGLNELGYWTTPAPPPRDQIPLALTTGVTPDYLKVMGIPLLKGRFVDDQDRIGSMPVVVIDEVLAQHAFHVQDAVGKTLWLQAIGKTQVVGVVGHVRHWGLAGDDQAEVRDQIYYPLARLPDRLMKFFSSILSLAVRTDGAPLRVVEPLRHELHGTAGDQVLYQIQTMEELASASLARQRFLVFLFGVFATLALLLACIGTYGVLAYLTSRRIPEIGVRMALGATGGDVISLVLRQGLAMILPGIALGTIAALGAGRVLRHLVAGMQLTEPLTLIMMISLLTVTALLASFVPARRASRLDAVHALRSD
jgi:predicted permease